MNKDSMTLIDLLIKVVLYIKMTIDIDFVNDECRSIIALFTSPIHSQ